MKLLQTLCCVFCLLWSVESYKILFLTPIPSYSHFVMIFRLAKELADRGHEVTCINAYPQKTPLKNYKDVSVAEVNDFLDEARKILFKMEGKGAVENLGLIYEAGLGVTERILKHKNVQKLLNSNETFDAYVMEQFATEALFGIGYHFKAPIILLSGFGISSLTNHFFSNPAPSSYVWNIMMPPDTSHLNFFDRVQNFILNTYVDVLREFYYKPQQRVLFKKYITSEIPLDAVVNNVSMIFANTHVSIYDAAPLVPSMVNIAGYHLNPPKKLPNDLQKFLDDSEEGVVLFSMGSNLKSKDLQPELLDAIFKSFAKIKQNVLWKFEQQMSNLPKNVKIMEWLPQQDVLAHPNIRAFITHGGMLSTIETVWFGVPMIGIPVFGDQMRNIATVANKGFCIGLPLQELTEETFSRALDQILNNPKYRENAKKRSALMTDRLTKPIDEAVYWVEHVIRHNGAPHLRTAARDLKWYQREMIDIFAVLFLVLATIIAVIYIGLKKISVLILNKNKKIGVSVNKKDK